MQIIKNQKLIIAAMLLLSPSLAFAKFRCEAQAYNPPFRVFYGFGLSLEMARDRAMKKCEVNTVGGCHLVGCVGGVH